MRQIAVGAVCAGVLLGGCSNDSSSTTTDVAAPPADAARVVLAATAYDGGRPGSGDLEAARDILVERIADADAVVDIEGDALVVMIPGDRDGSTATMFGRTGKLHVRPVLRSSPSAGSTVPNVADRQSSDPAVQSRILADIDCAAKDPLRGNDDPALPLVTCDADHVAYLLGPSIIDGSEIVEATARTDQQFDQDVIDIGFTDAGSRVWADFSRVSIGKQAAFTLDSRVLTAPLIQSPIPVGVSTQISGRFTAEEADALAATLRSGALPVLLSVESVN